MPRFVIPPFVVSVSIGCVWYCITSDIFLFSFCHLNPKLTFWKGDVVFWHHSDNIHLFPPDEIDGNAFGIVLRELFFWEHHSLENGNWEMFCRPCTCNSGQSTSNWEVDEDGDGKHQRRLVRDFGFLGLHIYTGSGDSNGISVWSFEWLSSLSHQSVVRIAQ